MKVRRDYLLEDAMNGFNNMKKSTGTLTGPIRIAWVDEFGTNEAGIDDGGLYMEFLYDLSKALLDPDYGLFEETSLEHELRPNVESKSLAGVNHLKYFWFAGIVVGRAIFDGILIDSVFSRFFLRRMLGELNFLTELRHYDIELYKHLEYVKHYKGDARDFTLTFSYKDPRVQDEVDLVPGGSNIEVTNANKVEYVYRVANYKLSSQLKRQIEAFLSGLTEVIPVNFLKLFTSAELQTIISGEKKDLDVADLRSHTTLEGFDGYGDQEYVQQFWIVLENLTKDEKLKFLKFVTSCSRPPLFGFKNLKPPMKIGKIGDGYNSTTGQEEERLPVASTCYNQLMLPKYKSAEKLKQKILTAINDGGGFYVV